MTEKKSIFRFGDKIGYESPFGDWVGRQKKEREEREAAHKKQKEEKELKKENSLERTGYYIEACKDETGKVCYYDIEFATYICNVSNEPDEEIEKIGAMLMGIFAAVLQGTVKDIPVNGIFNYQLISKEDPLHYDYKRILSDKQLPLYYLMDISNAEKEKGKGGTHRNPLNPLRSAYFNVDLADKNKLIDRLSSARTIIHEALHPILDHPWENTPLNPIYPKYVVYRDDITRIYKDFDDFQKEIDTYIQTPEVRNFRYNIMNTGEMLNQKADLLYDTTEGTSDYAKATILEDLQRNYILTTLLNYGK